MQQEDIVVALRKCYSCDRLSHVATRDYPPFHSCAKVGQYGLGGLIKTLISGSTMRGNIENVSAGLFRTLTAFSNHFPISTLTETSLMGLV
jgi:hypothetical protein